MFGRLEVDFMYDVILKNVRCLFTIYDVFC